VHVLVIAHNAVADSNRQRVDALARLPGLEVTLLSPAWWHEEGRRVEVAQPRAAYPWYVGRTLATDNGTRHVYLDTLCPLVRRLRPDVIDLHEEPFSLVALQTLVARAVLAPRAALVFYSAVNVARRWRAPYRWVERAVLRAADGAYAPNGDVPRILAARGLKASAAVVPLGVDVERLAAAAPSRLDITHEAPVVGFLGRLEPVKGLDVLLDAAARLARPATLVVAGDGAERPRLEQLVADRGIGGCVRFVGAVPFEAVPGFLKNLDVLVLPSVTLLPLHREQFGRVLAEAMAAGVAVVGSSSGAIPEVIGDAGLVVPERDPEALARALDRLLADPGLRAELAARGRARAAACFAWPVVARATLEQVYLPALAHRRQVLHPSSPGWRRRQPPRAARRAPSPHQARQRRTPWSGLRPPMARGCAARGGAAPSIPEKGGGL
jgi:glycosyltransferase involved in cell wall biosynthesis